VGDGNESADDPIAVTHARLLPGADVRAEGLLRVAPEAALVGSIGGELALGQTTVVVRGRNVAEMTALRGYAEFGVRVAF
jgi:hypothetical protein